jgi:hypothetical protein
MNAEIIERTLDAITEAKRELLAIDPHPTVRRDLDKAYRSMSEAAEALSKILTQET